MVGLPSLGSGDAELFRAAGVDPTGLLDRRGRVFVGSLAICGGLLGQVNLMLPGILVLGVPSAAYSLMLLVIAALGAVLILLPRHLGLITALLIGVLAVGMAAWLRAPLAPILVMCGLVLALELLNSAIEATVDLASPEKHDLAATAKDAAAGAVLLASLASVAVGLAVLGPPLWQRLFG